MLGQAVGKAVERQSERDRQRDAMRRRSSRRRRLESPSRWFAYRPTPPSHERCKYSVTRSPASGNAGRGSSGRSPRCPCEAPLLASRPGRWGQRIAPSRRGFARRARGRRCGTPTARASRTSSSSTCFRRRWRGRIGRRAASLLCSRRPLTFFSSEQCETGRVRAQRAAPAPAVKGREHGAKEVRDECAISLGMVRGGSGGGPGRLRKRSSRAGGLRRSRRIVGRWRVVVVLVGR